MRPLSLTQPDLRAAYREACEKYEDEVKRLDYFTDITGMSLGDAARWVDRETRGENG